MEDLLLSILLTNFVGASNILDGLNWRIIIQDRALNKIEWVFIPSLSPWWGGWWEPLIRILKKDLLNKTLKRASLNYEEMNTVLCDCESIVNSRPPTHMSEDPDETVVITPMFLREVKPEGVIDLDRIDESSLDKRLRYKQ